MAGTGHPYEIANLSLVLAVIDEAASRAPEGEAQRWFRSRHALRFLTSPRYVARVPQDCEGALEAFDPGERELLKEKAASGGDVRLFSQEMQAALGPDLGHVADWISWAERRDRRTFAKLSRITLEQAAARAAAWSAGAMSRAVHGAGKTAEVLVTKAGRAWVELLDSDALLSEGRAMDHCVGSYDDRVLVGVSRILSLREGRGRALVTVEIRNISPPTVRQAYAACNAPVPFGAQRCLAELLQHLRAALTPSAEAAGVTIGASGRWTPIHEAWERIEWNGYTAVTNGTRMLVMSPRNPVLPLASVTFRNADRSRGVAAPAENRHFNMDELRAAARIRNLLEDGEEPWVQPSWPGLQRVVASGEPARWVATRDLWERRELAGETCLVERAGHGEIVHVTKSGDQARTILVIGDTRDLAEAGNGKEFGYQASAPRDWMRWTLSEARRCMAVLTASGVRYMMASHDDGREVRKRYRPVVSPDGRWSLFMQDSVRLPALTCEGEWRCSDWLAELTTPEGSVSVERRGDSVVSVDSWYMSKKTAEEAASFMEARGWTAGPRLSGSAARSRKPGDLWVAFFRGRWIHASSPVEFVEKACALVPAKRAFRLSRAEAEAVFRALPEERVSEAGDRLLAAALAAWAREAFRERGEALIFDPRGYLAPPIGRWSESWEGRLRLAARLEETMSPATAKHVGRIAAAALRHAMKGTRGRRAFMDPRMPSALRILAEHVSRLPEKCAVAAIRKLLGGYCDFGLFSDARSPHPAWFGSVRRLADQHGLGHCVRAAAERALYHLKEEGLTAEDARNWLECFRLAADQRFRFRAAAGIAGFAGMLAARADAPEEDSPEWAELARQAEEVRKAVEKESCEGMGMAA